MPYKIQVTPTGLKADPMREFFGSPQGLFWPTWTKCPPRRNQWFQPFVGEDLLSFMGRSLTGFAYQFELRIQNPGHGLLLKISTLPKWRSRPSQWFQLTSLGNALGLTG